MRFYKYVVLSLLATALFVFNTVGVSASSWSLIGSENKNVRSFVVSKKNKNLIIYNDGTQTYRTVNGGQNWSAVNIGINFCSNFVQSNQNQNEYWATCFPGLYHSIDSGVSFQKIDNTLFNNVEVSRLRQDKDGSIYIFAGGISFRSRDGLVWEKLGGVGTYSPLIFPSLNTAGKLYASVTTTGIKGFYRSFDHGVSWEKISSYYVLGQGVNNLIFNNDGSICAAVNTYGYGCSDNDGLNWSGFGNRTNQGIPGIPNYIYSAYQNPDDINNVFVFVGDIYATDMKLYSIKQNESWQSEILTMPLNRLEISEGSIIAAGYNNLSGLFRNDNIAVSPDYTSEYPVIIVPGLLGSWEIGGKYYMDPLMGTYNNLINSLNVNNENNVYTFPYNWRNSNNVTAELLSAKINEVLRLTGKTKVNIVAHSMGGLITRKYIEGDNYSNNVNKVIFLGTPHLGSAKSYIPYESGDLIYINGFLAGNILNYQFGKEAKREGFEGANIIFRYIRERVSSIAELLPITNYIEENGAMRVYPNGYPRNEFLENLFVNRAKISERNIKTTNIIGVNSGNTISKFKVESSNNLPLWEHGIPINFYNLWQPKEIYYSTGDDTVSIESASAISDKTIELNGVSHSALPSKAINEIFQELKIENSVPVESKSISRYFAIFVHSPIDISVKSPEGMITGMVDGERINNIKDAVYINEGDSEFIILPEPINGEYSIQVTATGVGDYRIESHLINEDKKDDIKNNFEGRVVDSSNFNLKAFLEEEELKIENTDKTPPITNLKINGESNNNYYKSNVNIELEATDNEGGVAKTFYTFNNSNQWTEYSTSLTINTEGSNTLKFYSTDIFGNKEDIKEVFINIDKSSPYVVFNIFNNILTRWEKLNYFLKVSDEYSGVKESVIFLDDIKINGIDNLDLVVGKHEITIFAEDFAGNTTKVTKDFEVIVNYSSLAKDLSLLWQKREIKNFGFYVSSAVKIRYSSIYHAFGLHEKETKHLELLKRELESNFKRDRISLGGYNLLLSDIKYLEGR